MSWFKFVIASEAKQSTITREIASALQPRNDNDEVTDPGIAIDEYIPPQEEQSVKLAEPTWRPIRWVQTLLTRRHVKEETTQLIAKIERLSTAPDNVIRYFFDNDLPRLVTLSELQPLVVQQMLKDALNTSTNKLSEPWFRLVQIACGDIGAILPALDSLC